MPAPVSITTPRSRPRNQRRPRRPRGGSYYGGRYVPPSKTRSALKNAAAHTRIPRSARAFSGASGNLYNFGAAGYIPGPPKLSPGWQAVQRAYLHGTPPSVSLKKSEPVAYRLAHRAAHEYVRSHEGIHTDLAGSLAIDLISGGIATGLVQGAGNLAARGAAEAAGAGAAEGTAESGAARAAKGLAEALRGGARSTAKQAAQTVAGRAAVRVTSRPAVRTAAKVTARVASAPARYSKTSLFGGPVALQAPAAVQQGSLAPFKKALEGSGVAAHAVSSAANAVARSVPGTVSQAIVRDAFNLPAQALPSVYLPLAGAVEAAKGDSSRLEKLWRDYKKVGLIPALSEGDLSKALKAVEHHPLYSALEVSGAAAVAGRTAGALARGATGGRLAGTAREPLLVKGAEELGNIRPSRSRRYSPDLIRQSVQRLADRRRRRKTGGQYATRRQAEKALDSGTDRFVYDAEQIRRLHRDLDQQALRGVRKGLPRTARRAGARSPSADVVALAVQRIIRHPETFAEDLKHYHSLLLKARRSGELTPLEMAANKDLLRVVERGAKQGDPVAVVDAANRFIAQHGEIVKELVDRGLLTEEQAAKAAQIPFARVHMDAGYGLSRADQAAVQEIRTALESPDLTEGDRAVLSRELARVQGRHQVLDRRGEPLSEEAIRAEMARQGVSEPGFITQRTGAATSRGAFYRNPFPDRQRLSRARRTGASTLRGTGDNAWEAVVAQMARSRSVLDATKTFDAFVSRFGKEPPGSVRSPADAWQLAREMQNPELSAAERAALQRHFGISFPEGVNYVPVRRYPYQSLPNEVAGAIGHQHPAALAESPVNAMEDLTTRALAKMQDPEGDLTAAEVAYAKRTGKSPIVFVPERVVRRFDQHTIRTSDAGKAGQAVTTAFKKAILPTSPSYFIGNAFDNWMRTAFAGIGPFDIRAGYKLAREAGPESIQSPASGAGMSSVHRLETYRDVSQFESAGVALKGLARAAHTIRQMPGPKQVVNLYKRYADTMLALNAKLTEELPAMGALGKEARREISSKVGHWNHALMLGPDAYRWLAGELKDPAKNIQYAQAVEEVLGNWGKNSPTTRRILVNYAPFWMWTRAATRYVFLTLPAHHPIKTALIASAAEMTEAERKRFGLDQQAASPVPGFLQGGLPVNGGIAPIGKYSSFGYFNDWFSNVARVWLPQGQTVLQALQGRDWMGFPVKGLETDPVRRGLYTLAVGAEQFIPFWNVGSGIGREGISYLNPLRPASGGSEGATGTTNAAPWKTGSSSASGKAPWK